MTGAEFREIRKEAGLTQEKLARELDVVLRTITTIEQSQSVATVYEYALLWLVRARMKKA